MAFSIEAFERINSIGAVVSVIAAVLAAVAVVVTTWSGRYLDKHANEQIQGARATAETARKDTEELRQQNLKLEKEVEEQRTKRLELERTLGPRSLSPEQVRLLRTTLESAPPGTRVLIHVRAEREAIDYANQIARTLTDAGVAAEVQELYAIVIGGQNTGLSVTICYGIGRDVVEAAFRRARISGEMKVRSPESDAKSMFANSPMPALYDAHAIAAHISVHPKQPHI